MKYASFAERLNVLERLAEHLEIPSDSEKLKRIVKSHSLKLEDKDIHGFVYILGVNLALRTPINTAIHVAGIITKNYHFQMFLHSMLKSLDMQETFRNFFENECSTFNSKLKEPNLVKAFVDGEKSGTLADSLINWSQPKLCEQWHFDHLMKGRLWQQNYFTRMREFCLENLSAEESIPKFLFELEKQKVNTGHSLYQGVSTIANNISAGQGYIESLVSRNDDGMLALRDSFSPITIHWSAAGIATGDMSKVYDYLLPKQG